MRTFLLAVAAVGALAAPAAAKTVVRSGVPIDSLTPEGLTRGDVVAPAAEGLPVRIAYAGADGKPAVVIDVLVAADAAGARAALETTRRGVSRAEAATERSDLGDVGFGAGRIAGFAKDNVMIVVRRVAGSAQAEDLAAAALAAVEAAPTDKHARTVVRLSSAPVVTIAGGAATGAREVARMSVGGSAGSEVVAARVVATGAGHARMRSATEWSLVRTGEGVIQVSVRIVDSMLRVSTLQGQDPTP